MNDDISKSWDKLYRRVARFWNQWRKPGKERSRKGERFAGRRVFRNIWCVQKGDVPQGGVALCVVHGTELHILFKIIRCFCDILGSFMQEERSLFHVAVSRSGCARVSHYKTHMCTYSSVPSKIQQFFIHFKKKNDILQQSVNVGAARNVASNRFTSISGHVYENTETTACSESWQNSHRNPSGAFCAMCVSTSP